MFVVTTAGNPVTLERDGYLRALSTDGQAIISTGIAVPVTSILDSPETFAIQVGTLAVDAGSSPFGGNLTGLNFLFSAGTKFYCNQGVGSFCQLFFDEVQL